MKKNYVVGFGNLLMGDDGVGIQVVQALAKDELPSGFAAVDGGVSSLEVLGTMLDAGRIIVVDALSGGGEPGTVYRLMPADLGSATPPAALSLHDFTLAQAIALLAVGSTLPPMVIYGIEPADMAMGLELSPPVAAAAARVKDLILAEVWADADA